MSNLMDYMEWRGDVSFSGSRFNEVDNVILAVTSHNNFEDIVPSDPGGQPVSFLSAMKALVKKPEDEQYLGLLMTDSFAGISRMAAKCPRFSHLKLVGFVNELDEEKIMQFAAVTFILPDNSIYVSYRGTDDTIVGWKEDLRLSFKTPLPAHQKAAEYLESVASALDGKIRVGGYSKGGNLAMWAASHCPESVRDRILVVYNNDGPGFLPEVLKEPSYTAVADRIVTYIPQSSVIGGLLERGPICRIVKSNESGIMQHDPLSWEVLGPNFVHLEKRSRFGEHTEEALRKWIYAMTIEEREQFTDMIFSIIDQTGAKTLTDLNESKLKNFNIIMKSLLSLDRENRAKMSRLMKVLLIGAKDEGAKKPLVQERPDQKDITSNDKDGKNLVITREGELLIKFLVPDDDN